MAPSERTCASLHAHLAFALQALWLWAPQGPFGAALTRTTFLEGFAAFGVAAFLTAGLGCGCAAVFAGAIAAVVGGGGAGGGVSAALPKIGKPSSGCDEGAWAQAASTQASKPRANHTRMFFTRSD